MKIAFYTLGCKVNQYETNVMINKFQSEGFEIVDFDKYADVYVVNTCTVTQMSDKKSRQMLRRAKQINPSSVVCAVGCYAQVAKTELSKIEEIDLILDNEEKKKIYEYVMQEFENQSNKNDSAYASSTELIHLNSDSNKRENIAKNLAERKQMAQKYMERKDNEYEEYSGVAYSEHVRAEIKIQDGCDRFCTYCIIPYARGPVHSRKPENILSEITKLAQSGIKEVVITGIHISSYGKDFENNGAENTNENADVTYNFKYGLIDLLEEVNKIDGVERIRLGSLEPRIINKSFLDRLSKLEKICDHFHLSLQSGCDETLARMNRKYTTEQFKENVNLIRNYYPNVALTTDVIVGFPGETDEEFNKTLNFLKEINFSKMHVFKYSKRKGTPAATFENQVDENVKEERSKVLIELSDDNETNFAKKYLGKEIKVLFENEEEGHTTNYIKVVVGHDYKKENLACNVDTLKNDKPLNNSEKMLIDSNASSENNSLESITNKILTVIPKEEKDGMLII